MFKIFSRFPGILDEKTTFEKNKKKKYSEEKETIYSNIDLLTNF